MFTGHGSVSSLLPFWIESAAGRRAAQRRRRSGRQGASPRKALLQDVTYTGCSNNGTTFAVVELCDAGHCPYLTLVTGEGFGDIDCLELLRGTELSLDPASGGKVVLPLAHQSQAVLQHLLDQLLSRYRRAAAENRDATTATESLITLVQQLIRGRSFGPLQGCATTHRPQRSDSQAFPSPSPSRSICPCPSNCWART